MGKGPAGRPPKSERPSDAAPRKRYPYSIRATMRSVREYGLDSSMSAARTPRQFIEDASDVLQQLRSKYPGHQRGKGPEWVERLEGGWQDLKYFDLRFFAECARVPTSVLYAFTHLLGDIARDGDRANALNLLDSMIAGLQAAREYVADAEDDLRGAFQIVRDGDVPDPRYDAKLDCLRLMSIAYNGCRSPREDVDGLIG